MCGVGQRASPELETSGGVGEKLSKLSPLQRERERERELSKLDELGWEESGAVAVVVRRGCLLAGAGTLLFLATWCRPAVGIEST